MSAVSESPFLFHRSIPLCEVTYGEVVSKPMAERNRPYESGSDVEYETSYEWLAAKYGFWPLFLSVGGGACSLWNTGYDVQWAKWLRENVKNKAPAEAKTNWAHANKVLFCWNKMPAGLVFTDYPWWCAVLCDVLGKREPGCWAKNLFSRSRGLLLGGFAMAAHVREACRRRARY